MAQIGTTAEKIYDAIVRLLNGSSPTRGTKRQQVAETLKKQAEQLEATQQQVKAIKAEISKAGGDSKSLDKATATIEALKKAGEEMATAISDGQDIGDTKADNEAPGIPTAEIGKFLSALKGISEAAKAEGIEMPAAGATTLPAGNNDGSKVLAKGAANGGAAGDAAKAVAIVGSVTGEEILAAILKSQAGDAEVANGGDATAATTAVSFAKGISDNNAAAAASLAGAVSGGIALRSLLKGGQLKLAQADEAPIAKQAGLAAVTKLLGAIEDIMKKTLSKVLAKVKEAADGVRANKGGTSSKAAAANEAAKAEGQAKQ
ncbi:variable large family protein [Borrelia sp. RT5S]|uniref:variable large family protein n=1 Tax=Borrelia sp. RT5S TaxID=2898581 RepID=UPI001E4C514E|nr:variable large family protein [Borrelia sp. RT5S]UGQ16627.1 variable large family protein [Borrelia sp. RT5S]